MALLVCIPTVIAGLSWIHRHLIALPVLSAASPSVVVGTSGATITLTGTRFLPSHTPHVQLRYKLTGDQDVTTVHLIGNTKSETVMEFVLPPIPLPSGQTSCLVDVRVSQNRRFLFSDPVSLSVLAHPSLVMLSPSRMPASGQMMSIFCTGLAPVPSVMVRFKSQLQDVTVRATVDRQQGVVQVRVPPMACPPQGETDVWVDVAVDGVTFTGRRSRKLVLFDASTPHRLPTYRRTLQEDMWALWKRGELCDVRLRCTDHAVLAAHKTVLAAHSAALAAALDVCDAKTPLAVSLDSQAMHFCLRHMYLGEVVGLRTAAEVHSVRAFGQRWGVRGLAELDADHALDADTDFRVEYYDLGGAMYAQASQLRFTDVRVLVDQVWIAAVHKAVLAARSPVFALMFSPRAVFRENVMGELILREMSEDVARNLIEWIYTDQCHVDGDNAVGLLVVADRYQIDAMKLYIARFLAENMDESVCVPLLLASVLLNTPQLTPVAAAAVAAAYKGSRLSTAMIDLLLSDAEAERAVRAADPSVSFALHRAGAGVRSVLSRFGRYGSAGAAAGGARDRSGGDKGAAGTAAAGAGKAKEADESGGCVLL